DALALEVDGWAHEIVSNIRVVRRGLRVVEVASFERLRVAGQPKLKTFSAGSTILQAILSERLRPTGKMHRLDPVPDLPGLSQQ
ncbi:MAG: hypothetical protein M3281_03315, partial [Chloroflexota bacterium]|nr:hypothetical protein [Chloroflexota bacterium]